MTIQDSYIFKNDVPISYFDLYIDGIRFPYTKDYGYQIVQEYEDAFNYNEEQDKKQSWVYTKEQAVQTI